MPRAPVPNRLWHRVMADHKIFGQCSDPRQFIAVLKNPCFDTVTYLLHELQIERLPRGWIQLEDHVLLYHC